MTQIPRRVFAVWENGIKIEESHKIMTRLKLECSKCGKTFGGEWGFKCHIERCLKYHIRDRNHLLHMYCNRLIVLQTRVAKYCGVTEENNYRQCGLCKEEFESYDLLKIHTRVCRSYMEEYKEFMKKTQLLFDNLLLSYDALGNVFQKYRNDRKMIDFKENGLPPPPPGPYNFAFPKLEPLEEFFLGKYHKFFFSLLNFSHDAFIRFLKKRESNVVDPIDYLQKDPYVNFHRSEEENGADTETDYDSDEDKEDDDDGMDVEVSSDDDEERVDEEDEEEEPEMADEEMEDAGDETSGAESEDEGQEEEQEDEEDGADAAWILEFGGPGIEDDDDFDGLDDDEMVPVEYEEDEDEDEYIEVVL